MFSISPSIDDSSVGGDEAHAVCRAVSAGGWGEGADVHRHAAGESQGGSEGGREGGREGGQARHFTCIEEGEDVMSA